MDKKRDILNQLIEKGGIYGYAAKQYIDDEEKSKELIFNCYDQCHVPHAKEKWGEKLISEIEEYCKANSENLKKPDFIFKLKDNE